MKRWIYFICILAISSLLIIACSNETNDAPAKNPDLLEEDNGQEGQDIVEKENKNEIDLFKYFLPDGTIAHYEGEGIEFAELNIEVHTIADDFVLIDEDNGGVLLRKVFKVNAEEIVLLSEEPIDLDEALPNESELLQMDPISTYLKLPFEIGKTFDEWTITDINGSVETPFKNFENVLIIESVENDTTTRRYFVEGYGEVVRESIMEMEDDFDYVVISSLHSIK